MKSYLASRLVQSACCSESESVLIVLWLTSDFSSRLCGYYLHSGLVIVLIVCTDDEPAGGSEHYVVISGFYEPHLLTYLDEIGINVDCVIQLDSRLTPAKMPPPGIGTSGSTWLSWARSIYDEHSLNWNLGVASPAAFRGRVPGQVITGPKVEYLLLAVWHPKEGANLHIVSGLSAAKKRDGSLMFPTGDTKDAETLLI